MKQRISTLVAFIILIVPQLNSQVFSKPETFNGTKIVKGKYYNGSGGKGYWDVKIIDSIGRTIHKKNYQKKKLLSETKTIYDNRYNELLSISLYDINDPDKIDTNWVRKYDYSNNEIIEQITKYTEEDSSIVRLIENINDSLYIYREISYHFRKESNKSWEQITEHRITKNKNGLKTKWIKENKERKTITEYQYYQNGKLKRRVIKRIPEYDIKGIYTGGLGSNDQSWVYKYDKKGRVKILYTIIDGRKYKIAKYSYK